MVATIESEFAAPPNVPGADPASPSTWWPAISLHSRATAQPYLKHRVMPSAMGVGATVEARVDHGRWIADCPSCPSAQDVTPADPRFWCPTCGSGDVWHRVVFPKNRAAIEEVLDLRPLAQNRNWRPSETLADLKRENAEHKVGA